MLDVHVPHKSDHTWTDFFIHIATIAVGLLLAIALEQTVEAIHRHHERRDLQADLRDEANNNRAIIARDLRIQDLEPWFQQAIDAVDSATPVQGRIHITLPPAPCIPGSVGTAKYRYFAPSEAVWTTARESSLVGLLPVEQARMYARLSHNYDLLAGSREEVYRGCGAIAAMQHRLGKTAAGGEGVLWTLTSEQAERLARQPPRPALPSRACVSASAGRMCTNRVFSPASRVPTNT